MEPKNDKQGEYVNTDIHTSISGNYNYPEEHIGQYKDSFRQELNGLRKELEEKIEKINNENKDNMQRIESENKNLLPTQWFVWTIAALVAAVTAWWCVSYSRLLDWKDEAIKQIHEINIKSEINKANLDNLKQKEIHTIDENNFVKLKQ